MSPAACQPRKGGGHLARPQEADASQPFAGHECSDLVPDPQSRDVPIIQNRPPGGKCWHSGVGGDIPGDMHSESLPPPPGTKTDGPWWRLLNRYQWFVFIVAALGWLFDTMDQQLFALARKPAITALLGGDPKNPNVDAYGADATQSSYLAGRWED